MSFRFLDQQKLQGRTGARALIFVFGVLVSQWVAIGAMLGLIWLLAKSSANFDMSVSCSFVIFSSVLFTWLLFSKKGLKAQNRVASRFEAFVLSLFKPRIFARSTPFNNLHCDTSGCLGLAQGPYPPPPRSSLA